jgi:hypothetical protein
MGSSLGFTLRPFKGLQECQTHVVMYALRRRYGDTYKFQICGRQVIGVAPPTGISSLYQDVNKAFNTVKLFSRIMNILSRTKYPAHLFDIFEREIHRIMALNCDRPSRIFNSQSEDFRNPQVDGVTTIGCARRTSRARTTKLPIRPLHITMMG